MLKLAELNPNWDFDLVGPDRSNVHDAAPANVNAHGYLSRADYEPLLANADVALGTLALRRNTMTEACPLKLREYLAYGIPTIIAYRDTDFPEPQPFLLNLPNTEGTIEAHLEAVRAFVTRARGTRIPRSAIGQLDIREKEGRRLSFLESLSRQAESEI
jgi:hypothetical protein